MGTRDCGLDHLALRLHVAVLASAFPPAGALLASSELGCVVSSGTARTGRPAVSTGPSHVLAVQHSRVVCQWFVWDATHDHNITPLP